ncbi:hypothetical protein BDN70DRAFT_599872 [Pholiota conissans]|uniref:F-box domain-containing protein n=1 Tax=Pholiota conissans TaxID=109636 RepID=A0A9P5Z3U7_9AGAR|nr:hypothetical protein BDN70DRAFT_599872 [Pholiota conissans]
MRCLFKARRYSGENQGDAGDSCWAEDERSKLKAKVNHNHGKLIHRQPPEVTSNILEFCLPEDVFSIDFECQAVPTYKICAPLILSAVCSWWQTVAHLAPQLWSTIILPFYPRDANYPPLLVPALVKEWLDRSGKRPLLINFFELTYNEPWTPGEFDAIFRIIEELNLHSTH